MTNHRPEFIDNQAGNTLARALKDIWGNISEDVASEGTTEPDAVRIATAYFSPTGFSLISERLAKVPEVRLMLGADLVPTTVDSRKQLNETQAQHRHRCLTAGLGQIDQSVRFERDRLPFDRSSSKALRKLTTALVAGNIEVRRYEKEFLHAKAYIFSSNENQSGRTSGILAGSSNLTGAGLTNNLELNLGRYDDSTVQRALSWFDALWIDAEPYDLAEIFEEVLRPRTPWEIFLRVLWKLYGDEVEEDAEIDKSLPLTSFQKHGVARALRLIENTGGVIVADEVGLGKTFIAGDILQRYLERRQRALLVCPASLRDSTWKHFLSDYQLFVECLSFEELSGDEQLRDAQRPNANAANLLRPLDEYQLVIVDEAHNYRNPDAPYRAGALRKLLFGRRRDLLLLTATPVNNSLWDLYHLIRYFVRQDAQFAEKGILSLRERFSQAAKEDPSNLNPDILYPVIDATTVKRTRQFVKKHYGHDTISAPDGTQQPIVFPQPNAISLRYNLDELLPGFFDSLEIALEPDDAEAIQFARYRPDAWLLDKVDDDEDARARAMIGLLRSGLLKRFESSVYAFRRTVDKMLSEHEAFISALDNGHVVTTQFMKELSADDEAIFEELLKATEHSLDARLYDVEGLRRAVQEDRDRLESLLEKARLVDVSHDPKLAALTDALVKITQQAQSEAHRSEDEQQKRKVIIFSFFEDTVRWVRDFLFQAVKQQPELGVYDGRIVAVSGSDTLDSASRQQALQGFAPISMGVPVGPGKDRFDIMIATDVLAEGVNLQQCRHIINFDMPWNPMRMVQRHGRIDRIGSPHSRVFLQTIFPADRLDRLLGLEQRIMDKIALAAASVGVASPIDGAAHGKQVFSETREEIEKLLSEDPTIYDNGGSVAATQTGEEYRQTLRNALEQNREQIVSLPWKVGTGMLSGHRRGIFFCAVVGRDSRFERTYLRFVEADDNWNAGTIETSVVREVGTCLRLIECDQDTPRQEIEQFEERVYDFWNLAQNSILEDWTRETDPANLQPAVRPLNHRVAEFIRNNIPLDLHDQKVSRALDILESPWPRREELMLRDWFSVTEANEGTRARFLIEKVCGTGIEPADPPVPLPPISRRDVELYCWMAIDKIAT